MKIYKLRNGILLEEANQFYLLEQTDWDTFINRDNLYDELAQTIKQATPLPRHKPI
jgi:2-dehydro-3-deoxy-D-arabinonate dehydratase